MSRSLTVASNWLGLVELPGRPEVALAEHHLAAVAIGGDIAVGRDRR